MKNIIISFLFLVPSLYSQDVFNDYIKEAQTFYQQKNYKQAQLSLQDAITELNKLMSGQIVDLLPKDINGLKAMEGGNNSTNLGMMGGGGMTISKNYEHPVKKEIQAEIQLIANSPMISAVSMYFTNPSMMGEGAKTVRVGTTRAILKSEMQETSDANGNPIKLRSTEIHIPLGQTLITINTKGFANEQEELAFASKLDFVKIKAAVGE